MEERYSTGLGLDRSNPCLLAPAPALEESRRRYEQHDRCGAEHVESDLLFTLHPRRSRGSTHTRREGRERGGGEGLRAFGGRMFAKLRE